MRRIAALVLLHALSPGCGSEDSPQPGSLPVAGESASYVYHYRPGDYVDADWQETYHAWATAQLGVMAPVKVGYFKYRSRNEMGDLTGHYDTNGFALTDAFEIHTLWPTDNHEVVHVLTSLIGRPPDFFNEGMAVAFGTNPAAGDLSARFNGRNVHDAAREYLNAGRLVLPIDTIVETTAFRAVGDSVLSYSEAGSFVRFAIDRYGLDRVLELFRTSVGRDEGKAAIEERFAACIGVSLPDVETAWLEWLRP